MPPLLTQNGDTPLQKAEKKGYTAIVKTFEDVKASGGVNNWKLLFAAKKGDLAQLNAAIEGGANVEAKDSVRGIDRPPTATCLLPPVTSHYNQTRPTSKPSHLRTAAQPCATPVGMAM